MTEPTPVKKSLFKRILKGFGIGLLVVVLLVAATLGFFHLPVGKNIIRSAIEADIGQRFEGSVTLESFDWAIFSDIRLDGLIIQSPEGKTVVAIEHIEIKPDWGSLAGTPTLASVIIDGVAVAIENFDDGTNTLMRMAKPVPTQLADVQVEHLELKRLHALIAAPDAASFEIKDGHAVARLVLGLVADGSMRLDLKDFSAQLVTIAPMTASGKRIVEDGGVVPRWQGGTRASFGVAVKGEVALGWGEGFIAGENGFAPPTPVPTSLHAVFTPTATALHVESPDPRLAGADLKLPLELPKIEARIGPGGLEVDIGPYRLGPMTAKSIKARANLAETLAGATSVMAALGSMRFLLDIEGVRMAADDLNRMNTPATGAQDKTPPLILADLQADLKGEGPLSALVLTGLARWGDATLGLNGKADLSNALLPVWEVTFKGSDIAPKKLLALPQAPDIAAAFELMLKGRGLFPPDADIETRLDLGGLAVDGASVDTLQLAAGVVGEKITVSRFEVQVFGQRLVVTGEADRITRSFKATAESRLDLSKALDQTALADLLPKPLPTASGTLTLELAVEGTLSEKALMALEDGVRTQQPPVLDGMPFDRLVIGGKARIDDFTFNLFRIASLTFDIDLKGEGGLPTGPIALHIKDIRADVNGRTMVIDVVALEAEVAEKDGRFALRMTSAAEDLAVTAAGVLAFDPALMAGKLVLETLAVRRGSFDMKLKQPLVLSGDERGMVLDDLKILVAGGELALRGNAQVTPAADGNPAVLERFELHATMRGVDTGRLGAALGPAGRALRRMPVRLDGSLRATGTPAAPTADLQLTARTRARGPIPALVADIGATVDRFGVAGRFGVLPSGSKATGRKQRAWLDGRFVLPVLWPETPGAMARLRPDGQMRFEMALHEQRLQQWTALAGENTGDGTIAFDADFRGTPARPEGAWTFGFDVTPRVVGDAPAPPRIALAAKGKVTPAGSGRVTHDGQIDIVSENAPLAAASWSGDVAKSPLLLPPGAPLPAWTLRGTFSQDFGPIVRWAAPLLPPELADLVVDGALDGSFEAAGRANDLTLDARHTARIRKVSALAAFPALLPVELAGSVRITPDATALTHAVNVGPDAVPLNRLEIRLGLPGRGLLRTVARLATSSDARRAVAVSGAFTQPESPIADLARRFSAPSDLIAALGDAGGTVGGTLTLGGDLDRPRIDGQLGWTGFRNLQLQPSRAILEAVTDDTRHLFALVVGPEDDLTAPGARARSVELLLSLPTLPIWREAFLKSRPVAIDLATRAPSVPLVTLVPHMRALAKLPPITGRTDADIHATATFDPAAMTAALTALAGHLRLTELGLPVPDSARILRDGRLDLDFSPSRITITSFEIHESDSHRQTRWLKAAGAIELTDLIPRSARIDVTALDFLVGGLALDGPEGELDLDLRIDTDLATAVPAITLTFNHLDFDAPDRFIRAHHAQILSHGDIFDPARLGANQPAVGTLPVARPLLAPLPPDIALKLALVFPKPGRLGAFPLDVDVVGRLDVALENAQLDIRGRLDVVRGALGAMGWDLPFVSGAISAEGHPDTAKMELTFGIAPPALALRDTRITGWHEGKAFITARATLKNGLETIFSGVGGPNVLDMATLINTGRTRLWGAPDVPASGTVRFGNLDQGLVNTFIATNLRNFIFMDRALGFSDSLVEHERYGEIEWFDMQRYVPNADQRVSLRSRPLAMGVNQVELGWDWLLVNRPRGSVGLGPRLGIDARLGLGLFWQWSSPD